MKKSGNIPLFFRFYYFSISAMYSATAQAKSDQNAHMILGNHMTWQAVIRRFIHNHHCNVVVQNNYSCRPENPL